ncbi:unnamed protein product [Lymnaea stagnalis]|uniref:G-protein coupled receptors family 1 profile domain-containing protein n=1 Tax=Lymnaea stagnalis TaxID=6523 RepID=A0AAV2IKB0_LYMST
MLTIVVFLALCAVVSLFGVLSNFLSIVVLTRAGFQDTVSITLLGLSVSDLGSLLSVLWRNFTMRELVSTTDLPHYALEYLYLSGGTSLVWFTRTTTWISAYMTFKRFLCIIVPLKVKTIITRKRAIVIIVCIYVITLATVLPAYYATQMTLEFSPEANKSILVLFFTRDRDLVNLMASPVYNVVLQVASFIAVVAFTAALVVELENKKNVEEDRGDVTSGVPDRQGPQGGADGRPDSGELHPRLRPHHGVLRVGQRPARAQRCVHLGYNAGRVLHSGQLVGQHTGVSEDEHQVP